MFWFSFDIVEEMSRFISLHAVASFQVQVLANLIHLNHSDVQAYIHDFWNFLDSLLLGLLRSIPWIADW